MEPVRLAKETAEVKLRVIQILGKGKQRGACTAQNRYLNYHQGAAKLALESPAQQSPSQQGYLAPVESCANMIIRLLLCRISCSKVAKIFTQD